MKANLLWDRLILWLGDIRRLASSDLVDELGIGEVVGHGHFDTPVRDAAGLALVGHGTTIELRQLSREHHSHGSADVVWIF